MPVRASTRSGRAPAGVAARRRAPSRRSAWRALAERGEAPGAPGGRRGPGVDPGPVLSRGDPEAVSSAARRRRVRAHGRRRARLRERPHRPGRRRVQAGAGSPAVAPARREPQTPSRPTAGDGPQSPSEGRHVSIERRSARGGGDRVGEVVAGVALLVVGAVAPGEATARGREAGGAGGGRDPAAGVALGLASGDRRAVAVEAGRGVEVEAEQEAGDAPGLGVGSRPRRRRARPPRRRAARRRPSRPARRRRPRRCGGRSAPAGSAASARYIARGPGGRRGAERPRRVASQRRSEPLAAAGRWRRAARVVAAEPAARPADFVRPRIADPGSATGRGSRQASTSAARRVDHLDPGRPEPRRRSRTTLVPGR